LPAVESRQRAGFATYVLVVAILAGVSAVLYRFDVVGLLNFYLGEEILGQILFHTLLLAAPVLAYLLTRRPLEAFMVFFLGLWFGPLMLTTEYYRADFQDALIVAAAIEAGFLISWYRPRGTIVGIFAALLGAGAILAIPLVRYGDMPYPPYAVWMLISGLLAGVLAALLATILRRG
jgi:hypothetical protein